MANFLSGLRNANHTQTLDLADIYGRFVCEDNLIQRRVEGLVGGFGCGVKCLRSNQNSLLVYLMMVSFLVLVGKIPPDKKRCHRSGSCGCGDESGGSQHDKRIAVIENEFGEVDIDGHGSLVASHSSANEDIAMVNNGCLCLLFVALQSVVQSLQSVTSHVIQHI
nr:hypothetical protein [Tanacetum cinerariifolium]